MQKNSFERSPSTLQSVILGPNLTSIASIRGVDAAIADREARIIKNREIHQFDGMTVLVTVPLIALHSVQKRVLKSLLT